MRLRYQSVNPPERATAGPGAFGLIPGQGQGLGVPFEKPTAEPNPEAPDQVRGGRNADL